MTYAPPRFSAIERAADAWRISLADIDEHLFWIKQHRETIRAGREKPEYIRYCRDRLEERMTGYLSAVRNVSECEEQMLAAGIHFNRHGA